MGNFNTVGDALCEVFSSLINKNGKVFKALIANPDGNGTIEQIFNDIEVVRNEWCNNSDFYNQSGEILEKTTSFFSFLTRLLYESDESLKHRNELLFYRDGDLVWGDIWNIQKIFKRFFGVKNIYIVNNTNSIEENLITDGDFEKQDNSWKLDGCVFDREVGFSERTGVKFSDNGICKQTVSVLFASTYFLHFFLKGIIEVQIKDNNGRYWDMQAGEFGLWTGVEKSLELKTDLWDAKSLFFLTDDTISSVTIIFIGIQNKNAFLDYVRLFLKEAYSSFTLIISLDKTVSTTGEALGLTQGTNDPIEHVDYSKMSYIEQSNIFGTEKGFELAKNIYTELLDMVKPGGITSYIEILKKELDE
jgi:hypothetical protein